MTTDMVSHGPQAVSVVCEVREGGGGGLTLGGGGRGQSTAVGGEACVVDEQVELGAAARVGAQRAVLVEVQLARVHHLPGDMKMSKCYDIETAIWGYPVFRWTQGWSART